MERAVSRSPADRSRDSEHGASTQALRAKHAWVGMVLAMAGCIGLFLSCSHQEAPAAAVIPGEGRSLIEALVESTDEPSSALLEQAGFVGHDSARMPVWFADEIVDPSLADEFLSTEDWTLVRLAWKGDAEESKLVFEDELLRKGWTAVAGSEAEQRTFVKGKGRCRWLAVAFAEMESGLSVVMHIQHD